MKIISIIFLIIFFILLINFMIMNIYSIFARKLFINKIKNKYRWRIILKGKVSKSLVKEINECLEKFYKMKFKDISISVDINPNSLS